MLVFRPLDEVMKLGTEPWTNVSIYKPMPSLLDFTKEFVIIPDDLKESIKKQLEEKDFCLIIGKANSGKTWISWAVGYFLAFNQRKSVWYATVDKNFNSEDVFRKEIAHYFEAEVKEPIYFILDDCHLNPDQVEKFLFTVYEESKEHSANLKFMFTTRKVGKFVLRNAEEQDTFHDILVDKLKCQVRLTTLAITKMARGIVKKFIEIKNIHYNLENDELDSIIDECGGDLYLLYVYLRCWKYREREKLADVNREKVYELLWNGYDKIKLKNEMQRQMLCRLAAICQFEPLQVPEALLFREPIDTKELETLVDNGLVDLRPNGFFSIPENLSRLLLSAVSTCTRVHKIRAFDKTEFSIRLFKEDVTLLIELKVHDWNVIFQALNLAEYEKGLGISILRALLFDSKIWNEMEVAVGSLPLDAASSLITNIISHSRDKAEQLKTIYVSKYSSGREQMEANLKLSSADTIQRDLRSYSRIIEINSILDHFSLKDFQSIMERSDSLRSVIGLFYEFIKCSVQERTIARLAEALVSLSPIEFTKLIEKTYSIYQIGSLIRSVGRADQAAAARLIERFSDLNIEAIFLKKQTKINKKTNRFVSEKAVLGLNHLLSGCASFASKNVRRKIAANISNKLWLVLVGSERVQEVFWLLWNVYRCDPNKARTMVHHGNAGLILLQRWKNNLLMRARNGSSSYIKNNRILRKRVYFYLATLGLLHECGINIFGTHLFDEHEYPFKNVLQRTNETWKTSELAQPTLLVLSLIALSTNLPKEYEERSMGAILDQEPARAYVYQNNIPQVRGILTDLIMRYNLDR